MYKILLDPDATGSWTNLFYQGDPDYAAYGITCSLQVGDSGSLELTVPETNPSAASIRTRKSLLDFTSDGSSLGIFEVREVSHDIRGNVKVYAVGEMAWLFDSVQPQAEFHDVTVRNFLKTLLDVHNAQCPEHAFQVGTVDVTDSNDSLYRYTNREQTLEAIRDKLVKRLGGNLRLRRSKGVRYIDYVTDATYGTEAEQDIRFGVNILDYSDNFTVDDICSEVVPLGARLQNDATNSKIGNLEKRVTVESVNGGRDWVSNDSLVARFGHVRTTMTWDDVTMPSNLLAKARAWLASDQYERMHVSVRAVDLSMSDAQFGALRLGDWALVIADEIGMRRRFQIRSRTYHPDDPSSDEIELGDDVKMSFIASQVSAGKEAEAEAEDSEYRQTRWLAEAIENTTAMMTGDRGGYKFSEYDEEGRWLADYYMDSMDKSTAQVVHKVNLNGDAYSTNGVEGPYETAILANGTILGKFIQAHSVKAEQISQDYTAMWEDADTRTLTTARSEFKAADAEISAKVSAVERTASGLRSDLSAEVRVRADQISQTVKRGQINSAISQTAETIYIKSNHFGWESTYSSMTTNGKLSASSGVFDNCSVSGTMSCESSLSKTEVVNGEIRFYCRTSSTGSWKRTARISAVTQNATPWLYIDTASGSYKSDMYMCEDQALIRSSSNNNSNYSYMMMNRDHLVMSKKSGNNFSTIDIYPNYIELRTWPNGSSSTGILVKNNRIDVYGDFYVNGHKIT